MQHCVASLIFYHDELNNKNNCSNLMMFMGVKLNVQGTGKGEGEGLNQDLPSLIGVSQIRSIYDCDSKN